tara:strand:+ start:246 stop:788 length:543 start_codon:yes stop_codon:yes gene_type:complete
MPFIVGTGCLPELEMHSAAIALSSCWGGKFLEYSVKEDPSEIFKFLPKDFGLVKILGDAGMRHPQGISWLEALGAWKKPTVLLTSALSNGQLTSAASAYYALCNSLSVPILGVIQLGGDWDPYQRKLDGLPWSGFISNKSLIEYESNDLHFIDNETQTSIEEIVLCLRRKLSYIKSDLIW